MTTAPRYALPPTRVSRRSLYSLVADEAFRDGTGHFVVSEEIDGPALVAGALAEPFLEHIRRRIETRR